MSERNEKMTKPPRFRAIDPETGEDVTKHALVGVAFLRDFESWAKQMEEQGDFILSQSTGLTDSKGAEVFSHAIMVHPEHGDSEYTPFYLVLFNQERGMWVYYEICSWESLKTDSYDLVTENPYTLWDGVEEMFVVGNVGISQEQAWKEAVRLFGWTESDEDYMSPDSLRARAEEVMNEKL